MTMACPCQIFSGRRLEVALHVLPLSMLGIASHSVWYKNYMKQLLILILVDFYANYNYFYSSIELLV